MNFLIYLGFILLLNFSSANAACDQNWVQYGQICYNLMEIFATRSNALAHCIDNDGTLPIIKSQEEQDNINDYLYTRNSIVEGVWLGATRVGETLDFIWDDGSSQSFTNWATDFPTDPISGRDCARMSTQFSKHSRIQPGEWTDANCANTNYILCQKPSVMDYNDLVKEVIKLRQEMDKIIPIGFIYTQVGVQSSPEVIWPQYEWDDISTAYSDLFLRVLGDKSESIGSVQEESTPRLGKVEVGRQGESQCTLAADIPANGWSNFVFTGKDDTTNGNFCIRFALVESEEVRPRNTAVRIWKRVA